VFVQFSIIFSIFHLNLSPSITNQIDFFRRTAQLQMTCASVSITLVSDRSPVLCPIIIVS